MLITHLTIKTTGLQRMSNFNFNKLREQINQTGEKLRKEFKGSDANYQAVANRGSEWYEANSARLKNPDYIKRLKTSLKNSSKVKESAKKRGADPEFRDAVRQGARKHINSPDYVNPRGMLGKTRSLESRKKSSDALKGHTKPLEGNKKISQHRTGKPLKKETVDKMRKTLTGRQSDRRVKVKTPAGIFIGLAEAAKHYGIAQGTIKNWCNKTTLTVRDYIKPKLIEKGIQFDKNGMVKGFSWVGDPHKQLKAKQVQTPDGLFLSAAEAAAFYNISANAIRHRIKVQPEMYYLIDRE